tara:strand:- start:4274 stop:5956 length:1683 start_codon:yes stop_codon:yes gene_type:complete
MAENDDDFLTEQSGDGQGEEQDNGPDTGTFEAVQLENPVTIGLADVTVDTRSRKRKVLEFLGYRVVLPALVTLSVAGWVADKYDLLNTITSTELNESNKQRDEALKLSQSNIATLTKAQGEYTIGLADVTDQLAQAQLELQRLNVLPPLVTAPPPTTTSGTPPPKTEYQLMYETITHQAATSSDVSNLNNGIVSYLNGLSIDDAVKSVEAIKLQTLPTKFDDPRTALISLGDNVVATKDLAKEYNALTGESTTGKSFRDIIGMVTQTIVTSDYKSGKKFLGDLDGKLTHAKDEFAGLKDTLSDELQDKFDAEHRGLSLTEKIDAYAGLSQSLGSALTQTTDKKYILALTENGVSAIRVSDGKVFNKVDRNNRYEIDNFTYGQAEAHDGSPERQLTGQKLQNALDEYRNEGSDKGAAKELYKTLADMQTDLDQYEFTVSTTKIDGKFRNAAGGTDRVLEDTTPFQIKLSDLPLEELLGDKKARKVMDALLGQMLVPKADRESIYINGGFGRGDNADDELVSDTVIALNPHTGWTAEQKAAVDKVSKNGRIELMYTGPQLLQ